MADLDDAALAIAVRDHEHGATIALRVIPRAPHTVFAGRHGDALKLKVHAPPVEGAANEAVRRHVAQCCRVRAADVEVLRGERSRDKVVLIRGRDADEVRRSLAG